MTLANEHRDEAGPDTGAVPQPRPRRPRRARRAAAAPDAGIAAAPGLPAGEAAGAAGASLAGEGPEPDAAVAPAGPLPAPAALTLGDLAWEVARRELAALETAAARLRSGDDVEAVHDARVALRRLRAALSVFRDALPADVPPLRSDFGWVARELGAARDLDVLVAQVQAVAPALADDAQPGLAGVLEWLHAEQAAARAAALAALETPRYQDAIASLAAALAAGEERVGPLAAAPALATAPALLARRYRQLRTAGKALTPRSSAGAYHRLRIRAKRLRYTVDFFTDVYGRAARPLLRRLTGVQTLLGDLQDTEVARLRLRELQRSHPGDAAAPERATLAALRQLLKQRGAELRRDFPAAFRRVEKQWKRLRVVMEVRRVRAAAGHGPAPQEGCRPASALEGTAAMVSLMVQQNSG